MKKSSLGLIYDVSGKLCPLFTFESLFYLGYFPYLSRIRGEAEVGVMRLRHPQIFGSSTISHFFTP